MGPSGSGKSTLLHLVGLLDRPDRGSVRLGGVATEHLAEEERAALRRRHIGFIFQAFHLIGRLSALENVELPLLLAGVAPAERRRRAAAVLERVGLADRLDHRPAELSGGQQQRVAIARAVVTEPDLLLADEPTGNLDRAGGREVVDLLEALNRGGITLILVTHDLELGERAPRRIRMVDGAVAEDVRG
ncbi:MAG: macrolide export ATP-binding/permease protein MacB [Porticoccaceae bacterium]|nr:MAG: macrolide export ATP-binding/permease protein MacB [Porticoccaceae bacterium]